MLPPPRAAPRSAASAAENSTPIIAATSCCRRCEVSIVAALFSIQSHLTKAPFTKIALSFEAIGFSQGLDAYTKHFSIDGQRKRFAAFQGFANNHRGLLPARAQGRKDRRIEVSLRDGFRKNNVFPPANVLMAGRSAAGGRRS